MSLLPEWTSDVIRILTFGVAVLLVYLSRRWTGPRQWIRLDSLEAEQRILRRNLHSLQRDVSDWYRSFTESQDEILKEIKALQFNGTRTAIKEELDIIVDKVDHLEKTVEGIAIPFGKITQNGLLLTKTAPPP